MRIVLVGGGTGGHFYPLMAVAEAIRERDQQISNESELFYFGPDTYNKDALREHNIKYIYCPAGKQRRYFSWRNFIDKFKIIGGFFVAIWKLYIIYPDAIMSKGGYTSVPVVMAAWWYRIPVVIHESDVKPGLANKLAGKFARYIGVANKEAAANFKNDNVAHIGMPIRQSFLKPLPDPYATLNIPRTKPVIFITGGSLGAERLNNLVLDSLDELLPNYVVVHQTGEKNFEKVKDSASNLISDPELQQNYVLFPTMNGTEIAASLEVADLVVGRAGAGTIAEIALKGKPSILVPIPEAISHDQRTNAYAYAEHGAATVMEEKNFSDGLLASEVDKIIKNKQLRAEMSEAARAFTQGDAAYKLADILRKIGSEHA